MPLNVLHCGLKLLMSSGGKIFDFESYMFFKVRCEWAQSTNIFVSLGRTCGSVEGGDGRSILQSYQCPNNFLKNNKGI